MRSVHALTLGLITLVLLAQSGATRSDTPHVCDSDGVSAREEQRAAYDFGLEVQATLRDRDLEGFMALTAADAWHVPRKAFLAERRFDEVFPSTFVQQVLGSEVPCTPVGWRGFMLAHGLIWYDGTAEGIRIFAVSGIATEDFAPTEAPEWLIDDAVIPHECFSYPSPNRWQYREFAEQFGIQSVPDFASQPGLFLGNEIDTLEPISPSWCEPDGCDGPSDGSISIFRHLDHCGIGAMPSQIVDGEVTTRDGRQETAYHVIAVFDDAFCARYAPWVDATCLSARLLTIGDSGGGNIGWNRAIGLYGHFRDASGLEGIAPLRFFDGRNDALNHFEEVGRPLPTTVLNDPTD